MQHSPVLKLSKQFQNRGKYHKRQRLNGVFKNTKTEAFKTPLKKVFLKLTPGLV